ncbi:MAG: hybrid sensor histidine kinase/response regulator [Labilithrix sp.]|nr:hybrid sensor histidine kinase/response regulator [Labilithrix sp.]MBX3224769.1 hybrid sensor histidine kinase/response regulator [Labilithrix sp.]
MTDRGDDDRPESQRGGDPHRDLAGVLHDVSNALTVLLGWIGEARAPDATPETTAYALTIVEQRARIARDLARHAIGSPRIDEQLAAGEVARDVVDALAVEASRVGATMIVTGGDATAKLAGALDVSQVLTNLVMNALAYAPRGSEVTVDVAADDERVWIVVSDQGPGVPESRRAGVFRGESLRPGGTGVGLRHSRDLARAGGGDVELLPSAPGSTGARFRVTWPRVDAIPRPPVSAPRVRELSGVRVLLVEDDAAVTQLLETALAGRGADVTVASTGAELAAALSTAPYDAALVDLSPIAEDAGGAIARLRQSSPGIDLVLITGSADRLPDVVGTADMKLVRKPFELTEVLAALSKKA